MPMFDVFVLVGIISAFAVFAAMLAYVSRSEPKPRPQIAERSTASAPVNAKHA